MEQALLSRQDIAESIRIIKLDRPTQGSLWDWRRTSI